MGRARGTSAGACEDGPHRRGGTGRPLLGARTHTPVSDTAGHPVYDPTSTSLSSEETAPKYLPASGPASQGGGPGTRVQRSFLCPVACGPRRTDTSLSPAALDVQAGGHSAPEPGRSPAGAEVRPEGSWAFLGNLSFILQKRREPLTGKAFVPTPPLHGRLARGGWRHGGKVMRITALPIGSPFGSSTNPGIFYRSYLGVWDEHLSCLGHLLFALQSPTAPVS